MKYHSQIIVILLLILYGCASVPQQAFEKDSNTKLSSIALLEITNPREFIVLNIGGIGSIFGILGALAENSVAKSNSAEFTNRLKERNVLIGDELRQELKTELSKQGYEVLFLDGQLPEVKGNVEDYSNINTDADLILHVGYGAAGYLSTQFSFDYKPWLRVSARLVSTSTRQPVYFQAFNYGAELSASGIKQLPSNEKYAYDSFDELLTGIDASIEGIRAGVGLIGNQIAQDLNKTK